MHTVAFVKYDPHLVFLCQCFTYCCANTLTNMHSALISVAFSGLLIFSNYKKTLWCSILSFVRAMPVHSCAACFPLHCATVTVAAIFIKSLQIVAAFEFVVLLLLLLDLTLTLMWLRPQKFFTNMMKVIEVNNY